MRILVVEDEPKVAEFVRSTLHDAQFAVDVAHDGATALERVRETDYDLLVLDVMLPDIDGFEVCRRLRGLGSTTPVLMLSARSLVDDRVRGLDSGADDYLPKPFDLEELAARLRAIARRRAGRSTPLLRHGPVTLDPAGRAVLLHDQPVICTAREYAILEALLMNSGQVLSRQRLEEALYGWDDGVESNAVEVYIHHLRKKLGKSIIQTVRGAGYMIAKQIGDDG